MFQIIFENELHMVQRDPRSIGFLTEFKVFLWRSTLPCNDGQRWTIEQLKFSVQILCMCEQDLSYGDTEAEHSSTLQGLGSSAPNPYPSCGLR